MMAAPSEENPMNFDFSEEQKLLQKTARDYLDEHSSLAAAPARAKRSS